MEIGMKIKNARNEAKLTQEKAAEALGVSRQTISNWENEKSYPDIISVIKMSDLYCVSLDHLLKEEIKVKRSYMDYLEESTDVVKSKNKLFAVILIAAYLFIWTGAEIILWFIDTGPHDAGVSRLFQWILLPVATFIISLLTARNDCFGKAKWFFCIFYGIMYMLVPYSVVSRIDSDTSRIFLWPNIWALPVGAAISAAGLAAGWILHNSKINKSGS
ncbi:MAG: helix-turn-helix transcriptional regulator [Oscillospiraceae bacterium]|nr:helix-turn-helix transcriptional regulator [Oscillospiraceae bacterium]